VEVRVSDCVLLNEKQPPTDVTPHRDGIPHITSPNDSINAINDIHAEEPKHESEYSDITCTPMPWQRDDNEQCRDESKDGQLRILHCNDGEDGENKEYALGAVVLAL